MQFGGGWAVDRGVFSGAATTAFRVGASVTDMAVFVAFVATKWLLNILLHFDFCICNVDPVFDKVISKFG